MGVICWMSDCILSTCIPVAGDSKSETGKFSPSWNSRSTGRREKDTHVSWWEG